LFQDFKKLWCNLELDVIDRAIGPRKKMNNTKMRTIAYVFNLYVEQVMRVTLDGYNKGFRIGGRVTNNLIYADDVLLIATSALKLQELHIAIKNRTDD